MYLYNFPTFGILANETHCVHSCFMFFSIDEWPTVLLRLTECLLPEDKSCLCMWLLVGKKIYNSISPTVFPDAVGRKASNNCRMLKKSCC